MLVTETIAPFTLLCEYRAPDSLMLPHVHVADRIGPKEKPV